MGNRAVITFDKTPTPESLGIYLHWNGGPESVLAFLEAANELGVRIGDEQYEFARIVQIIGNFFGGTTSIGVGQLKHLDCDNGDNGLFLVSRAGGKITIRQSKRGKTRGCYLDLRQVMAHKYWHPDKGGTPILKSILDANRKIFKEAA
jgi:hypothetical protein